MLEMVAEIEENHAIISAFQSSACIMSCPVGQSWSHVPASMWLRSRVFPWGVGSDIAFNNNLISIKLWVFP